MDLTDLTQTAREEVLDFSACQTLLHLQHLLAGKAARPAQEDAARHEGSRYADTLARFYPGIEFEQRRYEVVARVRTDVKGALIDQLNLIACGAGHLMAVTEAGGQGLRLYFRGDGIGLIKETDGGDQWYEFFDHTLDLHKVREEWKDDEEAISDYLAEYFHEAVNPDLEDPYCNNAEDDCSLYFEHGSEEELERWLRCFLLTEPDIEQYDTQDVWIYAATESDAAYLKDDGCYSSPRLQALVDLALEEHAPVGWEYVYNDGVVGRASAYDMSPECLCWRISELLETATARERMAARREVRQFVEERKQARPALPSVLLSLISPDVTSKIPPARKVAA